MRRVLFALQGHSCMALYPPARTPGHYPYRDIAPLPSGVSFSCLALKFMGDADFGRFPMYPHIIAGAQQAGNHGLIEEQSRHSGGCVDDVPPRLN
ncbi:hypothetical protein ACU6QO_20340 [Aeromonas veronii]|uniref:hypothetical protein n=1 Tax=Aeromonas veronii TaxID=654 RepID=UPI00406D17A8